jgi:hypothetical protein
LPVRIDGLVQHTDAHGERKALLSDQAVYKMVKRRHREAKIKEVSPPTTARYDRRGERAMREAASHPHVPHFGD